MSNPKVFEFAKEIGMETLTLMDKIREWQLPVKNHMAELTPDLVDQIKSKLGEKASSGATKKVTVKKAAPKAVAPKTAPKTAASKAPTAAKKKAAAAPAAADAATAKSASKVIRRKAKDEEKVEEAEIEEDLHIEEEMEAVEVEQPPVVMAPKAVEPPVEKTEPAAPAPAPVAAAPKPAEKKSLEKSELPPMPQAAPVVSPAPATPTPQAPPAHADPDANRNKVVRRKEVVMSGPGAAPRRNIVGRMDLSRVAAPPPQGQFQSRAPGSGPSSGGGGGGFNQNRPAGPPRTSNRNIRTGFVPQAVPEVFDPNESRRSKFEDRPKKPKVVEPAAVTPGANKENEEKVHFDAAEFRKREMVFQPKKKKSNLTREGLKTQLTTPKASKRIIRVDRTMKLADLAQQMGVKAAVLMKTLMQNGVTATMTTGLDFDTIALIIPEFGFEAQNVYQTADQMVDVAAFGDLTAEQVTRPPIVTVMGHVDHGKTSLLDSIRKADVASGEAGGITQHIGAYSVTTEDGHLITFIDTPGHAAFTAMRARGANVTDIAIIVVAADDGVMPQTAEAISHAKAADVPIIVAVNKMDKPGANPDRIKQQLTEYEIVPEEWGGNTIFCEVSALKKTGIKELLEQVYLLAEIQELKANPHRSGTGVVIESRLEKGRGPTATLLVTDGTISVGQHIVAGKMMGRVKSLMNDKGERVPSAGPGIPVEVLGLRDTPSAGDRFDIVEDEKTAEEVARVRDEQMRAQAATPHSKMSLEDLFSKVSKGDVKDLSIILKTDMTGSLEAIQGMLNKLVTQEVRLRVIHAAVGGITESDVLLASTAKGIVIGFNVRPDGTAMAEAKRLGVDVRSYTVVYELMDELKKAMVGLLAPEVIEKVVGRAEVRNIFSVPKIGTIAGCFIVDGKVQRSNSVRLIREGRILYQGKIGSLRRFKDDAREVASGFECGIGIENFNDVKVGDVIEAFMTEEVARTLTEVAAPEAPQATTKEM